LQARFIGRRTLRSDIIICGIAEILWFAGEIVCSLAGSNMAQWYKKVWAMPLWRKVVLAFIILAMVLVGDLVLTASFTRMQLGREVARIRAAGQPLTFAELHPPHAQTAGQPDAAAYYIEALKRIPPGELSDLTKVNTFYRLNLVSLPASQFPGELREKVAQSITNAAPLLAGFDKGAQLPLSEFDIGIMQSIQVCKNRVNSVQAAISLLSLRTLDLIRAQNGDAAAQSIVSTLKLMRVFDTYPILFVQSRKVVQIRLLCSDICLLITRCRLSEHKLADLQYLLEETFPPESLETTLLAERAYQLEVGRNLIPRGVVARYLAADEPALPERLALPRYRWHRMRMFSKSVAYLRNIARLIAASQRPWPEPLDEIVDINVMPSKSKGLISVVAPLTRITVETLAAVRCVTTAIAVERYRNQYGSAPDSLEAICPRYIESIPLDPYTGGPLLYSRDDVSYKVYSAGSNRVDDGGEIALNPDQPGVLDIGVSVKLVVER